MCFCTVLLFLSYREETGHGDSFSAGGFASLPGEPQQVSSAGPSHGGEAAADPALENAEAYKGEEYDDQTAEL